MFAERDKHYPSRSGQTSLASAVPNFTKPVKKNNYRPSIWQLCYDHNNLNCGHALSLSLVISHHALKSFSTLSTLCLLIGQLSP